MQTTKVEIHYKQLLLINTHVAILLLSNRQHLCYRQTETDD